MTLEDVPLYDMSADFVVLAERAEVDYRERCKLMVRACVCLCICACVFVHVCMHTVFYYLHCSCSHAQLHTHILLLYFSSLTFKMHSECRMSVRCLRHKQHC